MEHNVLEMVGKRILAREKNPFGKGIYVTHLLEQTILERTDSLEYIKVKHNSGLEVWMTVEHYNQYFLIVEILPKCEESKKEGES